MLVEIDHFDGFVDALKQKRESGEATGFYCFRDTIQNTPDVSSLRLTNGYENMASFQQQSPYTIDFYEHFQIEGIVKAVREMEEGVFSARTIADEAGRKQYVDLTATVKDFELVENLHHMMKDADWYYEYSDDSSVYRQGRTQLSDIERDLKELCRTKEGVEEASRLWLQYVPEYSVVKPNFIMQKSNFMDEKTLAFNEAQFKRLGMQEAFSAEVVGQMKQRVPLIEHTFSKVYDGDKTDNTVHLKKSASSDHYFINKFDVSLQKKDDDKSVKQTFYVDNKKKEGEEMEGGQKERFDNNFTLKKAYNFLSGRPVFHADSQSWEQIDFGKKLANGNHATQRFDKNYEYDIEKVVNNYTLANPQYKSSLIESLQRGNLQKEKFVDKDGKVEEFYVSPSIRVGSLNMYDAEKKLVPIESQLERQLINKELGEKIKEVFQKKLGATNTQKQDVKNEQPADENKKKQTQANEVKPAKKSTRQKVKQ